VTTVLVVDDNPHNRELASQLLEDRYTVVTAADGEEALESIAATAPDLVLMDISMPKMDGFEALRRLRANGTTRHLPVVALTAHAIRGDRERMLNAGFDGYVSKPLDEDVLLSLIELLLARKA
jgi:CheY-like chemotaxis protein